jgi:hypothetical protein
MLDRKRPPQLGPDTLMFSTKGVFTFGRKRAPLQENFVLPEAMFPANTTLKTLQSLAFIIGNVVKVEMFTFGRKALTFGRTGVHFEEKKRSL